MKLLLEIIRQENIALFYRDLSACGAISGLYIHTRVGPIIILDKHLPGRPRLHRCVLAHELGHHFFPPRSGMIAFHRTNQFSDSQSEITVHQDEGKALRWATELLMPSSEVWAAIKNGYDTVPLLADYFNVTEWFARAKIGYIRLEERSKGVKLKWRDIISKKKTTRRSSFPGL